MDVDVSQSTRFYEWVAWFHANQKRVFVGAAAVIVVAVVAIVFVYYQSRKEVSASEALSEVRVPLNPGAPLPPGTASNYLLIAKEHAGTKAAARALLLAAGAYYAEGNYPEATNLFQRLAKEYPDSPWQAQAALGIASALETMKKIPEAVAQYDKVRRLYASDPVVDDAKLGLARMYEAQGNFTNAFQLYSDLVQANRFSGLGSEAGMKMEELLQKHPELAKVSAPTTPATTMITSNMPLRTGTNRPAFTFSNLIQRSASNQPARTATNRLGTNQSLLIQPKAPAPNP